MEPKIINIKVEITKFVEKYQPGIVEIRFIDAHNKEQIFTVKAPYVTNQSLDENSSYPIKGSLEGRIINEYTDNQGKRIITVTTNDPVSIHGEVTFDISEDQIQNSLS